MTEAAKPILSTPAAKVGLVTCALAVITAIVFPMMTPGTTATIFMTVSIMLMSVGGILTIGMLMLDDGPWSIYLIFALPPLAQLYFAYMLTYM